MKNQYYGDINDYLKYGLLRCFADAGLRIGVCWMLTADDHPSDGHKIRYLSNPESWRAYDPDLFDALANAIRSGARNVQQAEESALLRNASFSKDLVPDNKSQREVWLTKALAKLAHADLLFFDPDNGIEVQSKPSGCTGSCKYIYWNEIELAWARGASLLIFQHFPRQNRERYISRLAGQLKGRVLGGSVIPLVTSNVVYLLACQQRHEIKVGVAVDMIRKMWMGQVCLPTNADHILPQKEISPL
jgi:hypothetical protein